MKPASAPCLPRCAPCPTWNAWSNSGWTCRDRATIQARSACRGRATMPVRSACLRKRARRKRRTCKSIFPTPSPMTTFTAASKRWPRARGWSWNGWTWKENNPMNAIGVAVVQEGRRVHPAVSMETHDYPAGAGAAKAHGDGNHSEQAAIENLEQILGSMVHAISNSLNSVMAASQLANLLITQGRLDEAKASLNRVEDECARAARLVRDGRNLATLRVPDSLDGVDVGALLASCAAACTDLGEVRVDCEADLPLVHGQAD